MDVIRNGKLIHLEEPDDEISRRIMAAKEKSDRLMAEKKAKSEAYDKDESNAFSLEVFNSMLRDNEYFQGKILSLPKKQRFDRLLELGKWMDAKCPYILSMSVDEPTPSRKNATVRLDMWSVSMLDGESARVYAVMAALADDIVVAGLVQDRADKRQAVRMSFCVHGVWE